MVLFYPSLPSLQKEQHEHTAKCLICICMGFNDIRYDEMMAVFILGDLNVC